MKESTLRTGFHHTLRAGPFTLVWFAFAVVLGGTVFGLSFWMVYQRGVFLTTTSPNNTYSVALKGDKGRPFVLPAEVRADVSKLGQPFVSDIWLHSTADAFDLSFEAGFPDVRWLRDNTVEFYRAQYFEKGMDSLLVSNNAEKSIKYLRVQSVSKFFIFDMQPGASVALEIPAPRGDSQTIGIQGAFSDGAEISFNSKSFDRHSTQRHHSTYQLVITNSSPVISTRNH